MFEKLFKFPLEDFRLSNIRFSLRPELVVVGVLLAVAVAIYFYRRSPRQVSPRMRWVLPILRGLVLALLVVILLRPVLRIPQPVTHDAFVAVLVDDSASMTIEDAGAKAGGGKATRRSRLDSASAVLGAPGKGGSGGAALLEQLSEICPVRLFRFTDRTESMEGIDDLTGAGERTNLYAAMRVIDTELRGVPVAAAVLLTDGSANAGGLPQDMARRLRARGTPVPVYCVGFGDIKPPPDLEVVRVLAPKEVRRNTSVGIHAYVRVSGYSDPFDVILRKDQEVLQTIRCVPTPDVDIYRIRLGFQPDDKGTFRYTVEIPAAADEVIAQNNTFDFLVKIADRRLPVLYLEGSPREEYRYLRRALFRDKDFRIVSILRLAGPKPYILQGAEPEDGLQEPPEPGKPKPKTKVNGYPTTAKALFRFEAVIFGDIEAGYLTKEQLAITEAFVSKKGRGFLMLGGVNSFNRGKYHGTPIEKMLPVVLPDQSVDYRQREFSVGLTKAGETHPAMRQSNNVLINRSIWSKAPTLIGHNPIAKTKPAAEVLAVEPKDDSPVLVVQQYGAGRAAAFTTGGSWHWRMALPIENKLHEKFWRQLVRWLAVGAKGQIAIELNKDLFARNEPVSIRAAVLDAMLEPVNNAEVIARITTPGAKTRDLKMDWILSIEGVYQAQYEPADAGDYNVEVIAKFKDDTEVSASTTFSVGETLDEFSDPRQQKGVLEEIAEISGGKYYTPADADKIAGEIKDRIREMRREETIYEQHDLWDTWPLFGLLAVALSAEWVFRRRGGLM